jgi:leucyl-tRNA synthetase
LDGQPCADHDRATGEGVGPQDYTLIKLRALELPGKLAALEGAGPVFLMAATLRPETMYGQTNCWALPEGQYGAYRGLDGEVYVMTARSALNLSYQVRGAVQWGVVFCSGGGVWQKGGDKHKTILQSPHPPPNTNASTTTSIQTANTPQTQERTPARGEPECLLELTGQDLIGVPLAAPNCPHERVYVLPLLTILTNKGTGIVTSVPSDSPDDYTALMARCFVFAFFVCLFLASCLFVCPFLYNTTPSPTRQHQNHPLTPPPPKPTNQTINQQDLKKKPKLREKYGVKDEWVLPYEVIPIIDIPGFGDKAAQTVCEQLKVQSQNDTVKLAEAKQLVYLKVCFFFGLVLLVGVVVVVVGGGGCCVVCCVCVCKKDVWCVLL